MAAEAIAGPLSAADLDFFEQNGYVVLREAISKEQARKVCDEMWRFLGMDARKPAGWYKAPATTLGFVELYHSEGLWENRQNPRIVAAFQQLYGRRQLWVSFDRVCFKPPVKPGWRSEGFLHWDMDPWDLPVAPMELQGVLALVDTPAGAGGFHCVPGFHQQLEEWAASHPCPSPAARAEFAARGKPVNVPDGFQRRFPPQSIAMMTGDMVIWRRELPHGNGENTSHLPRLCQYLTYFPAREYQYTPASHKDSLWPDHQGERISAFTKLGAICGRAELKPQPLSEPPSLTPLGRRLVGLDSWYDE